MLCCADAPPFFFSLVSCILLTRLQVRLHDLSQMLQTTKREQMHAQQEAIEHERGVWKVQVAVLQQELDQEKHDKAAQQQWQLKFVAPPANGTRQQQLKSADARSVEKAAAVPAVDPVDDVFAKFAQSIALLPASSAAQVAKAGVLPFLTHLLRENLGDLVTGSVLLALVHLAIHEKPVRPVLHRRMVASSESSSSSSLNVKEEIVKAGAAAPLVHILDHARNPRVAVEAARLCAALASHIPNKRVLAAKNAVRSLIHLLVPAYRPLSATDANNTEDGDDSTLESARMDKLPLPGDDEVQKTALSALVNLSYGRDAIMHARERFACPH